jgi:hypothetical protein
MSRRHGYGEGTIRQQGRRSWQIRIPLGKDPVTGTWLRHTETFVGNKPDAEKRRRELLHERDRGLLASPGKKTLEAYLRQEWLPAVAHVSKEVGPSPQPREGDTRTSSSMRAD